MTRIREATMSDHDAIARLSGSLDKRGYDSHPTVADPPKTPRRTKEWLQAQFDGGHSHILVAEDEHGAVVGLVRAHVGPTPKSLVLKQQDIGWLHEIVVVPGADSRGTARALLERIRAWVESKGVHQIRATIWDFDSKMIEVVESLGFSAINRTFLWDGPLDESEQESTEP